MMNALSELLDDPCALMTGNRSKMRRRRRYNPSNTCCIRFWRRRRESGRRRRMRWSTVVLAIEVPALLPALNPFEKLEDGYLEGCHCLSDASWIL